MKRRSLGLLAGASLAAMKFDPAKAAPDPSLLKTTLTPLGGNLASPCRTHLRASSRSR